MDPRKKQLKILIVEDEPDLCGLIVNFLKIKGSGEILSTDSGQSAISMIEENKPDAVFLDIQLADSVSGMEVLEKSRNSSPEIKIIMMSAYKEEFGEKAIELGAFKFLRKPVQTQQILKIIDEISTTSILKT